MGSAPLVNNAASIPAPAQLAGSYPVVATYSGDANYQGSTSPAVTWVVTLAGTSVVVAVAPNPSTFGQPATLTATLTITNAPPSYSGDQLELVVTNSTGMTNWITTLFSYPPPITIGYTNPILYSNVFDGGTWNLAGTATTVANTLVGGTTPMLGGTALGAVFCCRNITTTA